MIKQNQKILNTIQVLIDATIVSLSLIIAWYIRFNSGLFKLEGHLGFNAYLKPLFLIVPLYLILYSYYKLYTPRRRKDIFTEVVGIIKSNIFGLIVLMTILFIVKQIHYSRYVLLLFSILSVLLTISERLVIRLVLRKYRRQGFNLKHILVLGTGEPAVEFLRKIETHKYLGYSVFGILDDNKKEGYKIKGVYVKGKINELDKILSENMIDEVIIAIGLEEYHKLGYIINETEKNGIRTQIIPDYNKYIPAEPYIDEIDGLQLINIRHVPLDNILNKYIKRFIDIILSVICIVLFSPIMIFTAITIKLTSPGDIIFRQIRVGLNNREFEMYKFRSMHAKNEVAATKWTTKDDPRKTKFGSLIRKLSVDELPQLFNVLKGDMSLIGPRPERPHFVERFREEIPKYMIKHQVRPGITGWAQVNGWRGDTSIKKRIECDIYYIENWSLFFDIKILCLTVFKGFVNKNAY
ncbi:MAG: undecaprenyl-phosphate glucose phosphotransferase [Firmicutes bacterium]|nr:undecaprenyl-phosphate glucose phosphotransferase [Bacillota bacterium]